MPFVTEEIWQTWHNQPATDKMLMVEEWPIQS